MVVCGRAVVVLGTRGVVMTRVLVVTRGEVVMLMVLIVEVLRVLVGVTIPVLAHLPARQVSQPSQSSSVSQASPYAVS